MIIWLILLVIAGLTTLSYTFFYYESYNDGHLERLKVRYGLRFWPTLARCVLGEIFAQVITIILYPLALVPGVGRVSGGEGSGTPVVLVHGYLHNKSGWTFFRWLFKRKGVGPAAAFSFGPRQPVGEQAKRLSRLVEEVKEATGSHRVDLVGHSKGGLVVRKYLLDTGGGSVRRAIFMASPHRGSRLAALSPTKSGKELLPSSYLFEELNSKDPVPEGVEGFALFTEFDNLVLPASSCVLKGRGVINVSLHPKGHVALLYSFRVANLVAEILK